ncbi:MAG: glycosyltransferase family 39 protein [Christensenellaceae bacterium]|nr:glycosyltransferase family 39 protein [Christensenellaceae bacterium]
MKRIISTLLIALLVICIPIGIAFADGENLIKNGDFEIIGAEGLPAGWTFAAYINDGITSSISMENDSERGKVVCLNSVSSNDVHLTQKASVEANTIYRLSCYIKTENVSGGAGANIAFENIVLRTDALLGTNGWTRVELVGRTGSDQTEIEIGCRLGGFSADSMGKAWFDGFVVEKLSSHSGDIVNFFAGSSSGNNNNNNNSNNNNDSKPLTESEQLEVDSRTKMAVIMIFVYVLAPIAIYCLLWYEKKRDKTRKVQLKPSPEELAPRFFDVKPLIPKKTDTKLHYTKKDWIFVCVLTAIYAVFAVTNLGSTKSPENYWMGTVGDTITFEFDQDVTIRNIWEDGGIAEGATYTLTSADGKSTTVEQKYGQMYRWHIISMGGLSNVTTRSITLTVTKGKVWLNEIAFIGVDGKTITPRVTHESGLAAIDEQDTIPEYPNYMNGMYFDELYHARTAYEHLHNLSVYEISHPPLGKIIISIGIAIIGMNPFGWRIMGALFGVAMLPVMYAFGKRMFKRSELALLATALFAFDFMHFAQTRISTIDVYGVFFNLCMTYYMYKFIKMDLGDSLKDNLKPLFLSGLFFGIGCASKWICIYTGAALAVMFFGKMIVMWIKAEKIKKAKLTKAEQQEPAVQNAKEFKPRFFKTCLWAALFFVVIPAIIYCASYRPYWTAEWKQKAENAKLNEMYLSGELVYGEEAPKNVLTVGETVKAYLQGVLDNQKYMYNYHSGLDSTHTYQSAWYEWPLSNRPIWFYSGGNNPDTTQYGTISSFGNPAVWWVCFVGTVAFFIMLLRNKIKLNTEAFFFMMCLASAMLPWMLISRCVFIYHYFATVPLIILVSVYVLKIYEDKYYYGPKELGIELNGSAKFLPKVKWIWLGLAIVLFAVFYPVISGIQVSRNYIDALQWLPTWTFRGIWHQ